MQFIANLISKFGLFIFFLLLEGVAFFFIISQSDFHKTYVGEKMMAVNGYFSNKISYVTHFKNLPKENESLMTENARLKGIIKNKGLSVKEELASASDSVQQRGYRYTTAQIVDYSLRKKDNYFLINKGRADGIKEDMAVLSPHGIVGAVLSTSEHHANVISVLHSKTRIKARVKGLNYFGIIQWDGNDHQKLHLKEIPKYLSVQKGDTILTAGESAVYPEGELIGTVSQIVPNEKTGDFEIEVTTFDDLANVRNVYVVENLNLADIQKAKEGESNVAE